MLRRGPLAAAAILASAFAAEAAVPEVVVSIKPLHSLVARIMDGVGQPILLVAGGASLHSFSLKPSQAAALEDAALVLWVGPSLETFLAEPLQALAGDATVLEAAALPGMVLLPPREGGAWEAHDDAESEQHDEHGGGTDGHLFLDPANAMTVAAATAEALAALDPEHAAAYAANGAALRAELEALDKALAEELAPLADRRFVVFHDAYQYFERRYGLHALGSITVSPDRQPGARRLREIQEKVAALGATCIFAEPGFAPALLETIAESTQLRTGVLDPEGLALAPGPALYGELLRGLADSLKDCLSAT